MLRNNNFREGSGKILKDIFIVNDYLKSVDLSNNPFHEEEGLTNVLPKNVEIPDLLHGIMRNVSIESLNLSGNKLVGENVSKALIRCLERSNALKVLNLESTE